MSGQRPENLKYTKTHEWIKIDGDQATCGVTDHAMEILSEVIHLDLPAPGRQVQAGDPVGVLESAKAVSDVHAPAAGEIIMVNEELKKDPAMLSRDPFGSGWLFIIKPDQPMKTDKLMSTADYADFIGQ